jgi:hypothetical protein
MENRSFGNAEARLAWGARDQRKSYPSSCAATSIGMAARLRARSEILDRRREIVEHPFGSIKQWMNQGAFLMKGLDNVRAEFSLTALVYNLRRATSVASRP